MEKIVLNVVQLLIVENRVIVLHPDFVKVIYSRGNCKLLLDSEMNFYKGMARDDFCRNFRSREYVSQFFC